MNRIVLVAVAACAATLDGSRYATGSVSYVTGGAFRIAGGGMSILFR